MAKKIKVYVDTGAFIAFLDGSDTYHSLFAQLFSAPPPLVTTPLVIAEGHGWFLKRYDNTRALQFMNFIEDLKALEIVNTGKKEVTEGLRFLRRFLDQDISLVDAYGLWLMKEMKISLCWSTDRHLSLTGVPLVIHG